MVAPGPGSVLGWIWHLLPAVVALGIGGFWLNRFFVRKANLASLVDRSCNSIENLVKKCAEYWTSDYSAADSSKSALLEAEIKATILHINTLVKLIAKKYARRKIKDDTCKLILDLQNHCTGGQFETRRRTADMIRIVKIISVANKLTEDLHMLKL